MLTAYLKRQWKLLLLLATKKLLRQHWLLQHLKSAKLQQKVFIIKTTLPEK